MKPSFRASKFKDFLNPADPSSIRISLGLSKSSVASNFQPIHFFMKHHLGSFLLILYPKSLGVINTMTSEQNVYNFDQFLLPIIAYDQESAIPSCFLCTTSNTIFNFDTRGNLCIMRKLDYSPVFAKAESGNLIFVDCNGVVYCYNNNNLLWFENKLEGLVERIFNFSWKRNKVLNVAVNKKTVYLIDEKGTLIGFKLENGEKVMKYKIYNGDDVVKSALIICDEEKLCTLLRTNEESLLQMYSIKSSLDVIYTMKKPNITDIVFNDENLIIKNQNEIKMFDKNSGELVNNNTFWTPFDDWMFYGGTKDLLPFLISKNNELSIPFSEDLLYPLVIDFDTNGNIWMTTKIALFLIRPMVSYEAEVLAENLNKKYIESSILMAALSFGKIITRNDWNLLDKEIKKGKDPYVIINEIINKYSNLEFPMNESLDQVNELIEAMTINLEEKAISQFSTNDFWKNSVSQVVLVYSYLSRSLLMLLTYYTINYKVTIFSRKMKELSFIIKMYAQLSILVETDSVISSNVLEDKPYEYSSFNSSLKSQISYLLDVDKVADFLLSKGKAKIVCDYLSLSLVKSQYFGFALIDLGRYEEACNYLLYNQFNNSELPPRILDILRKNNRDDIIIKLADLYLKSNVALIFSSYLNMKNYDGAFLCLQRVKDINIKTDLIRLLIKTLIENNQFQRLISYPYNDSINLFAEQLSCYSKETLLVAATLYHKLCDYSLSTKMFYLHARICLKNPTIENMKKALYSLVFCLSIMNHNDVAVRDISSNQLLTKKKITKIKLRVECCLCSSNPKNAIALSDLELLKLSMNSSQIMLKFIKVCSEETLIEYVKYLVIENQQNILYNTLQHDKRKWNYSLNSSAFIQFLKTKTTPPLWLVIRMKELLLRQLLTLCHSYNRKDILNDLFIEMHQNNEKVPKYLIPVLKQIALPQDLIEQFS